MLNVGDIVLVTSGFFFSFGMVPGERPVKVGTFLIVAHVKRLSVGARIMFITDDLRTEGRWFSERDVEETFKRL